MFFLLEGKKTIRIEPQLLGPTLAAHMREQLMRDLEGKIDEENGYCLWASPQEDNSLGEGIIDDDGNAIFTIKYRALYFNIYIGEVLDGVVTEIDPENGIKLTVGEAEFIIDEDNMPGNCKLDNDRTSYCNEDTGTKIQVDSIIRFRVVNKNIFEGKMVGIGNIERPPLGLIENQYDGI